MSPLSRRPWLAQAAIPTPLGPARIAATPQGLAGFWFDDQAHHPGLLDAPEQADQPWLAQARAELDAYWQSAWHSGGPLQFTVPLDLGGTPFQQAVWQALLKIACGQTLSYGAIAQALGRPAAVRAVGAAVGRNPVSVIVPCHRVLGHQGALTGYAGGLHRKRALLAHEQAPAQRGLLPSQPLDELARGFLQVA